MQDGRPVPQAVDGRSDVYSLGMVLYEALGGKFPVPPGTLLQPLRKCNPQVSPGLSDIIGKCLARNPRDRYPDAGTLAADLWAHVNDLPLRGVANRSLRERWRKWRRRRPSMLPLLGMFAALALIAGAAATFALMYLNQRSHEARAALADGQQLVVARRYAEAVGTFKRGLAQVQDLPGHQDLKRELTTRLRRVVRTQAAQELHDLADRFRALYGVNFFPCRRLGALESRCRAFWDKRELILDRLGTQLEPEIEKRVQVDLLELAVLGTDLLVRLAPADQTAAARAEALRVLAQAEALFGPSAVLYFERRAHAEALGLKDVARQAARRGRERHPQTAWEYYALGRALLRSGKLKEASG
jgi:hypothetical protein